ncbi:hypothetical protein FQR65_LT15586 [Abscondita terminalis]|nr:hypothetical protein FQR65_LT15586 [Abscondita terminalis]
MKNVYPDLPSRKRKIPVCSLSNKRQNNGQSQVERNNIQVVDLNLSGHSENEVTTKKNESEIIQHIKSVIYNYISKFLNSLSDEDERKANALSKLTNSSSIKFPSIEEIKVILEEAKLHVIRDADDLGMVFNVEQAKLAFEDISIPKVNEEVEPDIEDNNNVRAEEMNVEDKQEITEEIEKFENFETLNIRDYSTKILKNDENSIPFLKISVGDRVIRVRKSTLCWDENEQKKSSKRLQNKIVKKTAARKSESSDEILDISISDENDDTDFELESFIESDESKSNEKDIDKTCIVVKEKYYAVYYDTTWYIGRVVDIVDNSTSKIKFLIAELNNFIWPKKEDLQLVENQYIFYGPLNLIGNGPFELKRYDRLIIEKKYKHLKKTFHE